MLNIGYFKGLPTEYVFKYSGGRLRHEGQALAFYYWKHATQIVAVPTSSIDANLLFKEITRNFQEVTLQGQFAYRIVTPRQAAELLNFTIDPIRRSYVSIDPERIPQRIAAIIQTATRAEIQNLSLEELLGQFEAVASRVEQRVRDNGQLTPLGVELLGVLFVSARPTPEVARALEADYRETLLRKADEATAARRAAAVEDERVIKENELNTEIALEQQRQQLIALEGENARAQAENEGQALRIQSNYGSEARRRFLDLYRDIDPRGLLALSLNELGQNADKIGNLTITSEILASLLTERTDPNRPRE